MSLAEASSVYSFTVAGAFTAGFTAAVLVSFFMQQAPPAMFLEAEQDSFLPFLPSLLCPSWAKAVVPAKANRARASKDFFMTKAFIKKN
jgi:hypothetical protein